MNLKASAHALSHVVCWLVFVRLFLLKIFIYPCRVSVAALETFDL